MTMAARMAGASVVSAGLALAVGGTRYAPEIVLGMAGPLVETVATWSVIETVYRQRPERLTAVMITAFAGKLVFFGAYVAVALAVLDLRPAPFMVSFTAYFIALHLAEALALRRLFAR
jgi:hypothetical protein